MKPVTRIACLRLFLAPLFLPCVVVAQSQFWLNNHETFFGIDAPVFDAQGVPLAGSSYVAELWGGPAPDSLSPALSAYTMERVIVPFATRGYFLDSDPAGRGYSTILAVRPYFGSAWLQVRAWDGRVGATYEDVVAAGLGGYGESPIFSAVGTSPYREPPDNAAYLLGLQSFSLRAEVPEPSTWILLAFGGLGLWCALRRRQE